MASGSKRQPRFGLFRREVRSWLGNRLRLARLSLMVAPVHTLDSTKAAELGSDP